MSAFDYAATCKDLSIYPYLKTAIANDQVAIKLMIKPTELSQEIGDGSSSESISVDQTSYLSSMEVKNLHTRKENKMIMKKAYRESDFAYQRNQDGEESVDDDNSPRKEKRVAYTYKLVNDQVLSPLSQSSTGTSYSSIDQSDDILSGKQQKDVIPDEEGKQDEITHDGRVSESVNLIICNQSTPEESILIDETFQPVVAFSECRSPKILDRSLSSSSFITAKSTAKSPFKNIKKAAGRAFSFVAGGRAKKERKSMGVSSSQRHVQLK